ncbi:MAG: hypothetical protein JWM95_1721 [Gemmatimonadetes bacterium]|nr:hypothetical protein [Gemmatimonadota bacterium]
MSADTAASPEQGATYRKLIAGAVAQAVCELPYNMPEAFDAETMVACTTDELAAIVENVLENHAEQGAPQPAPDLLVQRLCDDLKDLSERGDDYARFVETMADAVEEITSLRERLVGPASLLGIAAEPLVRDSTLACPHHDDRCHGVDCCCADVHGNAEALRSQPVAPTGEPEPPQYVLDALKSIGIERNTEYPNESDWITNTDPHGAQPADSLAAALAKMQRAAESDGRRAASSQEEPHP